MKETASMLPMYGWLFPTLPWLIALRWTHALTAQPATAVTHSAEIIPFPRDRIARRLHAG